MASSPSPRELARAAAALIDIVAPASPVLTPAADVAAAGVLLRRPREEAAPEIAVHRQELFLRLRETMGQNGLSEPPATTAELALQLLWLAEDPAQGLGPTLAVARAIYPDELLGECLLD